MNGASFRFLLLALLTLFGLYLISPLRSSNTPEQAVEEYVRALYTRDYPHAYDLVSDADRRAKSRSSYLLENETATGTSLALNRVLSSEIRFQWLKVEIGNRTASVRTKMSFPNGNSDEVADVLRRAEGSGTLAVTQERQLRRRLQQLLRGKEIPTVVGEDMFRLVQEGGNWLIVSGWRDAPIVEFVGEVKDGLPWTFFPVQSAVRVMPGETVRNVYRVKNRSNRELTGKALHRVSPEIADERLEILQCFCLIRETLRPGEEKELPLIFRLKEPLPPQIKQVEVRYLFYPIESFRPEWERSERKERS